MQTFWLKIVASNRVFYKGPCQSLVFSTIDGEKAILAHHENTVIAVEDGAVQIQTETGEWLHGIVSTGFVQVTNNRATMLVLSAEKPEEIDIRRAEEAKERAEEQLRQKQSIQEYHISKAALARAMLRIKEAGKYQVK